MFSFWVIFDVKNDPKMVDFGPLFWPFLAVPGPSRMYGSNIRPNDPLKIQVPGPSAQTLKKGVQKVTPKMIDLGGTPQHVLPCF